MAKVLRGEEVERTVVRIGRNNRPQKVKTRVAPTFAEQQDAAKWFADRGWGKAATVLAGEGGVGPATITITLEKPLPEIQKQ